MHPATTSVVYSDEERVFLQGVDRYRTEHNKSYLRATDYLEIVKGLGYELPPPPEIHVTQLGGVSHSGSPRKRKTGS